MRLVQTCGGAAVLKTGLLTRRVLWEEGGREGHVLVFGRVARPVVSLAAACGLQHDDEAVPCTLKPPATASLQPCGDCPGCMHTQEAVLSVWRAWLLQVALSYYGPAFKGWMAQKQLHTVEGVVQQALGPLCPMVSKAVAVSSAGRTDKGVSAAAQVSCCWAATAGLQAPRASAALVPSACCSTASRASEPGGTAVVNPLQAANHRWW